MASDSSPANIHDGPSSPDAWPTSPISNTHSTPGDARRPKRGRRSSYATPSPLPPDSPFPDATPTSRNPHRGRQRRLAGTPNAAATPSSTDDVPPSSEAGYGDEDEAPPMYVWGTNISVQDVNAAILRFLRNFREKENPAQIEGKYMRDINHVIETEGDSIDVDAHHVFDYDSDLYMKMVRYPLEVLAIFDLVLMEEIVNRINPLFSKHIQARIFNLKTSTSLRNLNPSDVEKMVSIKGMIIRCSSIIPEIREAVFRCLVCGYYSDPAVVNGESMSRQFARKAEMSLQKLHDPCSQ
ncbi:DNA replication licensing factor, mcm4 component [Orobanche gracilis]